MPKRKAVRKGRGGAAKKGSARNSETGTAEEGLSESVETREEKSGELVGEQTGEVSTDQIEEVSIDQTEEVSIDQTEEVSTDQTKEANSERLDLKAGEVKSLKEDIEDIISITAAIESQEALKDLVESSVEDNTAIESQEALKDLVESGVEDNAAIESQEALKDLVESGVNDNAEEKCKTVNVGSETLLTEQQEKTVAECELDFCEVKGADDDEEEVQYIDEEADEDQQLMDSTDVAQSENTLVTGETNLLANTDKSKREKDVNNHYAKSKSKLPETEGNKFEEISEGSIDQVEQEEITSDVAITKASFKPKKKRFRSSKSSKSNYKPAKTKVPFSGAESLEEVFFVTENDDLKVPAEDKDNDYISDSSFSDPVGTNLSLEEISDDDLEPSKKRRKSLGPAYDSAIEVKVDDLDPVEEIQSKNEPKLEKGNEAQVDSNKNAATNEGDEALISKKIKISEEKDSVSLNDSAVIVVEDKDEEPKEGHSSEIKQKTESQDKLDEASPATGFGGKFKKEDKSILEMSKLRNFPVGRSPAQFSLAARDYPDARRGYEMIDSSTQTESKILKGKIVQCNINPIDRYFHSAKPEKIREEQFQSSKLLNKFRHLLPCSIPLKVFTDITSIKSATKAHAYTFSMGPVTMSDMDSHEFRDVAVKGAEKFHLNFDTHCQGIFQSTLSNYENMATLIKKLKRLELGNRYMCMSFTYNFGQDNESEVWKATILFMYEQDIQIESMGLASDDKIRARLHLTGLPKGVSKDFINLLFPEALSVHTSSSIHEERAVTLGFSNPKLVEEILTCYDLVVVNGYQVKITKVDSEDALPEKESVEDADVMIVHEDMSVEKCDVSMPVDILTETTDKAMQATQQTVMRNSESISNKDSQTGDQVQTLDYSQFECKTEVCLDEGKEAENLNRATVDEIVKTAVDKGDEMETNILDKPAIDKIDEKEIDKMDKTALDKVDEEKADKINEKEVDKINNLEVDKLDKANENLLSKDALETRDLNVESTQAQSSVSTDQEKDTNCINSKSDASLHETESTSKEGEAFKPDNVDIHSEVAVAKQLEEESKPRDLHLEDVSDDDMTNPSKNTTLEHAVTAQESRPKAMTLNIDLTNEDSDSSNGPDVKDSTKPSGQAVEKKRETEKLVMTDGSLQVSMEVIDVSEDESSEKILYAKHIEPKKDLIRFKSREGEGSFAPKLKKDHWSPHEHKKATGYYPLREAYSKYPPKEEHVSRPSPYYDNKDSRELSYYRKVSSLDDTRKRIPYREPYRVPYRESTTRRRDMPYTEVRSRSPSPKKESSWYRSAESYKHPRSHYQPDNDSSGSVRKYSSSGQQPYEKWQQPYYADSKKPEYYTRQGIDADVRPKDWHPRGSGHHGYSSWQGTHHGASKYEEPYVQETKEPGYVSKKYPVRRSRSQSYSDMSSASDHHSPIRRKWSPERKSPKRPLKHTSRSPISISSRSRSLSPVSKSPSPGRTQYKVPGKVAIVDTVRQILHLAKDLRESKRQARSISPESCSPIRSRSPVPRVHSPVHFSPSPPRYEVSRSHKALTHSSPRALSRSPPPIWHKRSRSPKYSKRHQRSPSPSVDSRSKRYKKHEYSDSRHDSYHRDSDSSRRDYSRRSRHSSSPSKDQTKTGQWSDQRPSTQTVSSGDQQWPPSYASYQSKPASGTPGGFNPNYPPPPVTGYPPQETASMYQSGNMYQYSTPSQYGYTSMPPTVQSSYATPAPIAPLGYQQQFSLFQSAMSSQPPPQQTHFEPSSSNKSSSKNKKSWSMGSNAMVFQRILSNDGGKKQSKKESGTIEKIGDRERQERPKQTKEVRVLTSVPVNER